MRIGDGRDLESGLRTDKRFDLGKACLRIAGAFRNPVAAVSAQVPAARIPERQRRIGTLYMRLKDMDVLPLSKRNQKGIRRDRQRLRGRYEKRFFQIEGGRDLSAFNRCGKQQRGMAIAARGFPVGLVKPGNSSILIGEKRKDQRLATRLNG
ncbi:hypothetical protein D3C87_1530830 [compost metagenome]